VQGRKAVLRLDRHREEARILDPRSSFSEAVSEIEVRIDPLTGARSRINISRTARPKQSLAKVEAGSTSKCLFCPESIETVTPKFPSSFLPQGRYKFGGATLFPNLFPLAGHHGICVFTPEHKLELGRFNAEEVLDGLRCSLMYVSRSAELGFPQHFMGWNHLPPAGASILHPHFQIVCSREPLAGQRVLQEASKGYFRREGKDFWSQLTQAERSSPRFIGETNGFTWLAPWAPFGAFEVLGVSRRASVMEMGLEELHGMAEGIVKVLRGYACLGVASVNMGVFSLPAGEGGDLFRANVRIMSRPGTGMSDRALLELYGGEIGLSTLPEDYASVLKEQF
jgi:UDPglucose--hexose-1-phosphate uridylyltransferase